MSQTYTEIQHVTDDMTQKLEEFFNIAKPVDMFSEEEVPPIEHKLTKQELFAEARVIYTEMSTAEKIDQALPAITDLEAHDGEMDIIASKALRTFDDLVSLGNNVSDMQSGKIFEVAGQMLKTALEAKNAKADRKMRMIELQLKRMRLEQIDAEMGNTPRGSAGGEFDRNELLKHIASTMPPRIER